MNDGHRVTSSSFFSPPVGAPATNLLAHGRFADVAAILLLFSIGLTNQECFGDSSQKTMLGIEGLKESYKVSSVIEFKVVKNIPDPVSFACAAELQVNGEFQERRWDIFQNALKAVSHLRPKEIKSKSLTLKWDIPHQLSAIRPREGDIYRLRIDTLSPKGEPIYSRPFLITR